MLTFHRDTNPCDLQGHNIVAFGNPVSRLIFLSVHLILVTVNFIWRFLQVGWWCLLRGLIFERPRFILHIGERRDFTAEACRDPFTVSAPSFTTPVVIPSLEGVEVPLPEGVPLGHVLAQLHGEAIHLKISGVADVPDCIHD